jgi:hypothetical protein
VRVALGVPCRTKSRTPASELPLVKYLAPSVARTVRPYTSGGEGDEGGEGGGGATSAISYVLLIGYDAGDP